MELSDGWQQTFLESYKKLNDAKKNELIDKMLATSSYMQLYHLHDILGHRLTHEDFIVLLPVELSEMILSYLDMRSLFACCQVSRRWNEIISSFDTLWCAAGSRHGFEMKTFMEVSAASTNVCETAKQFCKRVRQLTCGMKSSSAFQVKMLQLHKRIVTAVCLWKNMMAAASDDGLISLWNIEYSKVSRIIEVDFRVTCLRANDSMVIASSSIGSLAAWDVERRWLRRDFGQHTGAVFSFDFNVDLDLLVSGSADKTVRVWSLSGTALLRSLRDHEHWVVNVLLGRRPRDTDRQHVLVTMEQNVILVWRFGTGPKLVDDIRCSTRISIFNEPSVFFTPGLHFDGEHVFYIQQEHGVCSETMLCEAAVRSNATVAKFPVHAKVKILLAVSNRYVCIAKPQTDDSNVVILDRNTLTEVASWSIPPSRQATPVCAQIAFGDGDWLNNGVDGFNHKGTVMAVGLESGDICLVKWKND